MVKITIKAKEVSKSTPACNKIKLHSLRASNMQQSQNTNQFLLTAIISQSQNETWLSSAFNLTITKAFYEMSRLDLRILRCHVRNMLFRINKRYQFTHGHNQIQITANN
ncbi:hypothetical protein CIPAW_01G036900 [Carya illinoinensis]|uniref:Uncharacterized protein n=1 Tax=Carya illinoinensis TaxID=32201 RepID=A0A8T1RG71_CARIL|nr:hypothetical protein CIPAW_01G036900 [Carya illinoinensis]